MSSMQQSKICPMKESRRQIKQKILDLDCAGEQRSVISGYCPSSRVHHCRAISDVIHALYALGACNWNKLSHSDCDTLHIPILPEVLKGLWRQCVVIRGSGCTKRTGRG